MGVCGSNNKENSSQKPSNDLNAENKQLADQQPPQTPAKEEKLGESQPQSAGNQNQLNESVNAENQPQKQEGENMNAPPAPMVESQPDQELIERNKHIQDCLALVNNVGEEGSIKNIENEPVDIIAVRQSLNFE